MSKSSSNTSKRSSLKNFVILTKFILSFAVSLSALFVYVIGKGDIDLRMILVTLSVLLVAMGVSTLNQVQEYKNDAKMPRTAHRPVACGMISPNIAILIALSLIASSLALIYWLIGLIGVDLFLFAFLWYNGVYTPLKRKSAFAVVPGAILGVIPPAVGWLAAGEKLFTLEFVSLGLFYFIWQIPHFWLLVMLYHKDYKEGGYPTAMSLFGKLRLQRVTFAWLMLTINVGIFKAFIFDPYSKIILFLLIATAVWGFFASVPLLKNNFKLSDAKKVFWHINLSFWTVSILLAVDAYISHHIT